MITEALQAKLDSLPSGPGVYLFKGASGKTIYIGKAKSLRNRVRSYFRQPRVSDQKANMLRGHIQDLDYILTDTDVEALMLESNLVEGSQAFPQPRSELRFGQSITDSCIGWETTEAIVTEAYDSFPLRFSTSGS